MSLFDCAVNWYTLLLYFWQTSCSRRVCICHYSYPWVSNQPGPKEIQLKRIKCLRKQNTHTVHLNTCGHKRSHEGRLTSYWRLLWMPNISFISRKLQPFSNLFSGNNSTHLFMQLLHLPPTSSSLLCSLHLRFVSTAAKTPINTENKTYLYQPTGQILNHQPVWLTPLIAV